jgi:hypothetical protein
MLRPARPGVRLYMPGGGAYEYSPAGMISGKVPTPETNFTFGDPDTWAVAPDIGVVSYMDFLHIRLSELSPSQRVGRADSERSGKVESY